MFVWVYEGAVRCEEGEEDEESEMILCTVTSSFPLRPYVEDQISSSISSGWVIASKEGASNVPERVFIKMAVDWDLSLNNFMPFAPSVTSILAKF